LQCIDFAQERKFGRYLGMAEYNENGFVEIEGQLDAN